MSTPIAAEHLHPPSKLEIWLAFAFGVVFVTALLILATVVKNPEPFAIRIYFTVLALAAGGVGAVLPGLMELRYKTIFRAGGSLALFAVVFFSAPAVGPSIVHTVEPKTDPEAVVQEFLSSLKTGSSAASWALLPNAARELVSNDAKAWDKLYTNALAPLGTPTSRTLIGETAATRPMSGFPPGVYRGFTYKTKFSNDSGFRLEQVTVRGNDKEAWEVFSYNVSPGQIN